MIERKRLFVDRRIQAQLIGVVLACGIFTSLILTLGLNIVDYRVQEILTAHSVGSEVQEAISLEFRQAFIQFGLLTLISVGWAWILSLFLTHRIVGPIRNITRTLDFYTGGEKALRIKLRKKDHFQDLAEKINKALDSK
jgi:methyl-accepting chemotaxis protein